MSEATATADADVPASAPHPWWMWVSLLGLDAVLTALLWMHLFARATGARLIAGEYVVLGCAVWCVYAADRMMDGLMVGGRRAERHLFAARWRVLLSAGIAAAAGISAWLLAFRIREIVGVWGLKLLAGVAVYFGVTWVSRRSWTGLIGAASLGGVLTIGLMQGTVDEETWPHLWRGALAGFLVTVLYLSVKNPGLPAPWTLPRKLLGGWLFAMGTALVPHAHLEAARDLMFGAPVLLFGLICALNSLGIRLWENGRSDYEHRLLGSLYPWMLVMAAAGAAMEWIPGDKYSRLLFGGCGLAAALLLLLHLRRRAIPAALRPLLADVALMVSAALMLGLRALMD